MGQKDSQYVKTPLLACGRQGLTCVTKKKSCQIPKQNISTIVPACKGTGKDSNLDMADGGQTEGLAGVTKKKSNWILKQKLWSWSGGDYTIVDNQMISAFKVTGKLSFRKGMFFFIPGRNKPIAYMQEKLLALRTTWKLFTFSPNFVGQAVTCKTKIARAEVPIYQYALIEAKIAYLLGEMRFKRYVTDGETEDVWEAKVKFSWKFKLDVRKAHTKEIVAQIGQTSAFQWASEYAVKAAKGLDRLSLIAFAISCEKIIKEGS